MCIRDRYIPLRYVFEDLKTSSFRAYLVQPRNRIFDRPLFIWCDLRPDTIQPASFENRVISQTTAEQNKVETIGVAITVDSLNVCKRRFAHALSLIHI